MINTFYKLLNNNAYFYAYEPSSTSSSACVRT